MPSKALVAASLKPFVLSILADGPSYGYAIIKRVSTITEGRMEWTTGTLYPLLHSLQGAGLLESFWADAESGPRRKYYRITAKGRRELAVEKQEWRRLNLALSLLWGEQGSVGLAGGGSHV